MSSFKEIVTKAVIGKVKKSSKDIINITPDFNPDTILGCWVINHSFSGLNNNDNININGNYDINIWYSYDNNTKTALYEEKYNYNDKIVLNKKVDNDTEVIIKCLKEPAVVDAKINNKEMNLNIEKEMGVELVGNTKVKIEVEDYDDDYEELIDNNLDEEISTINEEYLDTEEVN